MTQKWQEMKTNLELLELLDQARKMCSEMSEEDFEKILDLQRESWSRQDMD